jgi:hypothetical protein
MAAAASGTQTATAPPPPKEGKGIPPLGEADGLLVHLHQGPDIPTPNGEHLLRHRPPGFPERGLGQAGWRDPETSSDVLRGQEFLQGHFRLKLGRDVFAA